MHLIVYKKTADTEAAELQLVFEPIVGKNSIEIYNSAKALRRRIVKFSIRDGVVILIAQKRDDLTELLPIIDLFRRVRIVLILPDRKPETIKIGYKLEPRFLSFIDKGYEEIRAVIKKMVVKQVLVKDEKILLNQ